MLCWQVKYTVDYKQKKGKGSYPAMITPAYQLAKKANTLASNVSELVIVPPTGAGRLRAMSLKGFWQGSGLCLIDPVVWESLAHYLCKCRLRAKSQGYMQNVIAGNSYCIYNLQYMYFLRCNIFSFESPMPVVRCLYGQDIELRLLCKYVFNWCSWSINGDMRRECVSSPLLRTHPRFCWRNPAGS